MEPNEATRAGVYLFALAVFAIGFAAAFAITLPWMSAATAVLSVAVGALAAACVRVRPSGSVWAVLRFGRFHRIAGPGLYAVAPFVEYAAMHVDQRTMTSSFSAEASLTADLVRWMWTPSIFWVVWDAKKPAWRWRTIRGRCCGARRTAMRDAIGR